MFLSGVRTRVWWERSEGKSNLEDLGADARILKWIFIQWDGGHGLDWPLSKLGQVAALVNAVRNLGLYKMRESS